MCAVVCIGLARPSQALACEPVRALGDVEALPLDWRQALASLVLATQDESQPWGCSGGTLTVTLDDPGATLRVERLGVAPMSRHVDSPADLLSSGKAMLAAPMPATPGRRPSLASSELARDGRDGRDREQAPASVDAPRARIDATGMGRYAARSDLFMMGGGLRGTLPIDAWYGALAARYTTLASKLDSDLQHLSAWELSMALALGYSLLRDPVRLDAGIHGGVAIINMSAVSLEPSDPAEADAGQNQVEGGAVDGRVGLELRLAIPLADVLNALIALDAELAPGSLGAAGRRIDESLPPLPACSVGLSAGLEVGVP